MLLPKVHVVHRPNENIGRFGRNVLEVGSFEASNANIGQLNIALLGRQFLANIGNAQLGQLRRDDIGGDLVEVVESLAHQTQFDAGAALHALTEQGVKLWRRGGNAGQQQQSKQ